MRHLLRNATDAAHRALHGHPAFAALLRGNLSRDGYARLLSRLLGLHDPIERRLRCHDAHPLMAWRRIGAESPRPSRLRQDLSALGIDADALALVPMADAAILPATDNIAAALGCAWVVEGSAMGGVVLSRHVAAIVGGPGGGDSFFSSQPHNKERWRQCCAAVEQCGSGTRNRAIMVAAAIATFAAFQTWLIPDKSPWASAPDSSGSGVQQL
ncbi:MAG: biliverdin-producing heme oxygenase [Acetobacteraceae bacterium]